VKAFAAMSDGKRGVPAWVWIVVAIPLLVAALGVTSALALYGVRKYLLKAKQAEAHGREKRPPSAAVAPPTVVVPPLEGDAVDLSTVMGRARKLANAWQPEAALLGVEATLVDAKIQTQDGASAKVTFGPSPFDTTKARTGLFVVVYDRTGINGAPAAGKPGPILPEPMCAPERVLTRLTMGGEGPTTLRYGLDSAQRPMWMATSQAHPKDLKLFDPQDCAVRGFVGPRRLR
jgi:hypothetical protein